LGRDGRTRPVAAHSVRQRIASALAEQPGRSLRAIAAQVGASPETVRNVRRDLEHVGSPSGGASTPPALSLVGSRRTVAKWGQDKALTSDPFSVAFLKWFQTTDVTDEWARHIPAVPLSRVYEVADEARRRARLWQEFADGLEGRARRSAP